MHQDPTLQFMATDAFAYVVALPASIAAILVMIGIGWWITRGWTARRPMRRHNSSNGYWNNREDEALDPTEIINGSSRRRRLDPNWDDAQHNEPVDAPSTGRHAVANPHRTRVPADWKPVIGAQRIALFTSVLLTDTAAYHAVIAVARVPTAFSPPAPRRLG